MYEELLPIWKRRCKALRDGSPQEAKFEWGKAIENIQYQWLYGSSDTWMDCIVCGVMLFTWEQGIAE